MDDRTCGLLSPAALLAYAAPVDAMRLCAGDRMTFFLSHTRSLSLHRHCLLSDGASRVHRQVAQRPSYIKRPFLLPSLACVKRGESSVCWRAHEFGSMSSSVSVETKSRSRREDM